MAQKINFILSLEGNVAKMVLDKMEQMKIEKGTDRYGKARATKLLLCELWAIRNPDNNKRCD